MFAPGPYSRAASVLKFIRDNPHITGSALAKQFNVRLHQPPTTQLLGTWYMIHVLQDLERARLITSKDYGDGETTYQIADWWTNVQTILNISLSELALKQTGGAMTVSPTFGPPTGSSRSHQTAFVMMPFAPELKPVYEAVEETLLACNV